MTIKMFKNRIFLIAKALNVPYNFTQVENNKSVFKVFVYLFISINNVYELHNFRYFAIFRHSVKIEEGIKKYAQI